MKIKKVKTAFKIADVKLVKDSTKLKFEYLEKLINENGKELPQSVLRENLARVYLIVVDGEIKKIGGSQDAGGIKGTLRIYQDGGVKGRPSIRSYGIWYFLYSAAIKKQKVEFYMIYQDNFEAEIKGLFGLQKTSNASINYKLIEEACINDYLKSESGKFPPWNVQEQAGDWPMDIKQSHAKILSESTKKKLSGGRRVISN